MTTLRGAELPLGMVMSKASRAARAAAAPAKEDATVVWRCGVSTGLTPKKVRRITCDGSMPIPPSASDRTIVA